MDRTMIIVGCSSGFGRAAALEFLQAGWAVEGLTEALHYELEPRGIVVKLVEPGFVPNANIIEQVQERSSAIPVPSAYKAIFDQMVAMYMGRPSIEELGTETDVKQAILAAASDGTDRLRYVVGPDAEMAARMRREASDDEYLAWARLRFSAAA